MIKTLLLCLAGASLVAGMHSRDRRQSRGRALERQIDEINLRQMDKKDVSEHSMQEAYLQVHEFLRSKPFGEPTPMSEQLKSQSVHDTIRLWDKVKYQQGGRWRSVQRLTPWSFGWCGFRKTFYNMCWRSADKPVFDPVVYNGKSAEEISKSLEEIETSLFNASAIKDEDLNQMHQDIKKYISAIEIYHMFPKKEQPEFPDTLGITVGWDNHMEQKGGVWNSPTYRFRNPTPPQRPPAGHTRPQRPIQGQGPTGQQTQTTLNDPNTSGNNKSKKGKKGKGGMGAGWIILIIVASLAVIGVIVYFTVFHGQSEDSMV